MVSPFVTSTFRDHTAGVRLDGRRQRDDFLLHHSLTMPEVPLDGHSDNVFLDNVFMVGVGGTSILQLLQSTKDLVEACVNFNHWDNSEHCGPSKLS